MSLLLGGQFTYQTSVGDNRLTGSSFDTWVGGARVAISLRLCYQSRQYTKAYR